MNSQISKNTILYGPPGTGKTYYTTLYAVAICDGKSIEELEHEEYSSVKERYDELVEEDRIAFTTFHQSYGYEEFVEGIKPVVDETQEELKYFIEDGTFKEFCRKANNIDTLASVEQNYVFIIDEINRGNISKIFGELITLIEDTKRDGMPEAATVILPYSKDLFSVPSNIYILGTMNTADRSIALMDTALRRRFQFEEMMPDPEVLRNNKIIVRVGDKILDVADMLEVINKRIEVLYDREHTIGHALFIGLKDEPTIERLAMIFSKSLIPLLQEYFYEDYQKIQMVLGDNAKTDDEAEFKFIKDNKIKVREVFAGNIDDFDIPEKTYEINQDALYKIESYKSISSNL